MPGTPGTPGTPGEVDLEKGEVDVDVSTPGTPGTPGEVDVSTPGMPGTGGNVPLEPVVSRAEELPLSRTRLMALVVTLTGSAFLNTLGVQAVVIILPSIGEGLEIPGSRHQWVLSAYSLAFGCFLLLCGRIADVYGKRLIFLVGSVWFTAVSIAVPFAPNEISFDFLRGLQGIGAAANVPTALGIIGQTIPPGKTKNFAFAFYGAGAPLGAVFGNILSGLIGEYISWKWTFWVLAMLAAICTTVAIFVIPPPPAPLQDTTKLTVDWIGGALITIGLLVLLFALTEGNVVGWSTPWIPALVVVSLAIIGLFIFWQWYLENRTTRQPLMKISIWHSKQFCAAMMIMALFFSSFNNYLFFITYFFQEYQGLSVIQTMVRFIPMGVAGLFAAYSTGFLLSRVRANYILVWGTICVAISSLLYAVPISPSTTYWAWGFPAMAIACLGADTLYATLTLFTAQSLPSSDQAMGGALINAVGQIGRAISLAITTAIQTAVTAKKRGVNLKEVGLDNTVKKGDAAFLVGLRAAMWAGFAMAVMACFVVIVAFREAGKIGLHKKK
ncbi:MFS general substrate transporter [Venturia nashicola]|nr:MFS general substrate transporter [Venturia nashicola]